MGARQNSVMPRLDPGIHALTAARQDRRGWPGQARPRRTQSKSITETIMKLSLDNKIVMITGPAKGMGAAITHAFAAEGCKLALLGRDTAAIKPVADEVRASGREAIVIA